MQLEGEAAPAIVAGYAEAGDFAEAARWHQKAEVYQRLKLDEEGKPCREKWAFPSSR